MAPLSVLESCRDEVDESSLSRLSIVREVCNEDTQKAVQETRRKKVAFHLIKQVRYIEPTRTKERSGMWFNERELNRFKYEAKRTVKRSIEQRRLSRLGFGISVGLADEDGRNSVRGLESHLSSVNRANMKLRRLVHRDKVLTEIRRQKQEGTEQLDWEKIRESAAHTSAAGSQRALALARKDELDRERAWEHQPTKGKLLDFGEK
jgi:hypothetical protein